MVIETGIYDPARAFGDFAIRNLKPQIMEAPHWHGHVEINALSGAHMTYDFDSKTVELADGGVAMFWAGVPHRSIAVTAGENPSLTNIYLPLDRFLLMPHIANLQRMLLAGAIVSLPSAQINPEKLRNWQDDLFSPNSERHALVVMELNTILRRVSTAPLNFLLQPNGTKIQTNDLSSSNVRHVVTMIRHVMENLGSPLSNSSVTRITGLHMNYALSIFSSVMRIPLKRFIIRMRLTRARGLLVESNLPVASIAANCGFGSLSQFYEAFKAAYGTTPRVARFGAINETMIDSPSRDLITGPEKI